jgi:hypothetical protein
MAIVFLVLAIVLTILWSQHRKSWMLAATTGCLLLIGAAFLYDQAIVTPREQVSDSVLGITHAFRDRNLDQTLSYVSDSARDIKLLIGNAYNWVQLQPDMRVTDIQTELIAGGARARARFRVNGTVLFSGGTDRVATLWESKWQDEDGQWKLIEITPLDPVTGEPESYLDHIRKDVRARFPL